MILQLMNRPAGVFSQSMPKRLAEYVLPAKIGKPKAAAKLI
jgi:hypothetical protein